MQHSSQKATAQPVNQVEVSDIVIGSKFPNLNLPGKKRSTKALSPPNRMKFEERKILILATGSKIIGWVDSFIMPN